MSKLTFCYIKVFRIEFHQKECSLDASEGKGLVRSAGLVLWPFFLWTQLCFVPPLLYFCYCSFCSSQDVAGRAPGTIAVGK